MLFSFLVSPMIQLLQAASGDVVVRLQSLQELGVEPAEARRLNIVHVEKNMKSKSTASLLTIE